MPFLVWINQWCFSFFSAFLSFKEKVGFIRDLNKEIQPISWSLQEKAWSLLLLLINADIHLHCHFQGLHFQPCFPLRPLCLLYAPVCFFHSPSDNEFSEHVVSRLVFLLWRQDWYQKIKSWLIFATQLGEKSNQDRFFPLYIMYFIYLYEIILDIHFYCY